MSNNIYDILGKLKGLLPTETPVETAKEPVYENVEPRGDIMEAVKSLEEKYMSFKEAAKPDFLDLDKDGDTDEPMKKAAKDAKEHEPSKPDADAVAKRKRLQALKDKQEDERAERGDDDKSSTRVVKGRAYGGSAQKDDEDKDELEEKAPPGAKAERMVKHIKKGYAKDGKLTDKEKSIAYATAWKAHNKGQVEEGTEFGDTIENSKAELTKAKPAVVKESSMMESSSYTYEKIADILAKEQPNLDCNGEDFQKAVYNELIKMHLSPKSARWNVYHDEDFLSDCATAYAHNIKHGHKDEDNLVVDAIQELDEIARLAGLSAKQESSCMECGMMESSCECNENTMGAVAGGVAGAVLGKSPMAAQLGSTIGDKLTGESEELDEEEMDEGNEFTKARLDAIAAGKDEFTVGGKVHKVTGDTDVLESTISEAATRKDFRQVADLIKQIPDKEKRKELAHHHSGIFQKQNPRFKHDMFCKACGIDESDMTLEAVTEDININVTATGEEDVVNLVRKLAGMPVVHKVAEEEVVEEERDIEWDNTPEELTAPLSAAIPSGNDLHKAKIQDPETANKAANPLKKEEELEESLWKRYEDIINDVKA